MPHIYCVKIKQLLLGGETPYDYFPFDRVYLVPLERKKLAYQLFRYSLVLPLDDKLAHALSKVNFEGGNQIDVERNDQHLKGTKSAPQNMLTDLQKGEWLAVVPTYLARDEDINPDTPVPVSREVRLAYTFSHIVGKVHNLRVSLPTITVHTPEKDIPFLCAMCRHVANYHSNRCSPGRAWCRHNMRLTGLPLESDARQMAEKSVKGSGETQ